MRIEFIDIEICAIYIRTIHLFYLFMFITKHIDHVHKAHVYADDVHTDHYIKAISMTIMSIKIIPPQKNLCSQRSCPHIPMKTMSMQCS